MKPVLFLGYLRSFSLLIALSLTCGYNAQGKNKNTQQISQNQQANKNQKQYQTLGSLVSLSPKFNKIIAPNARIEIIASGHTWTEGPVWVPALNALLYSDVPRNIAYKWTEEKGVEEYLNPSGYSGTKPRKGGIGSNGLALDANGNLILCRSGDRELALLKAPLQNPTPTYQTIANNYNGKKFNSPNDVIVDKKGNYYFTDPNFGLDKSNPNAKQLDFEGVYKVSPSGQVKLLTKTWPTPNGIGISPNGKTLYLANSQPPQVIAIKLNAKGKQARERVIFDASELWQQSIAKQKPDGMAVNKNGILFVTGPDGVLVLSPKGTHLGTILTQKRTSNCTFNPDESILYITCDDLVLRVKLRATAGLSVLP